MRDLGHASRRDRVAGGVRAPGHSCYNMDRLFIPCLLGAQQRSSCCSLTAVEVEVEVVRVPASGEKLGEAR